MSNFETSDIVESQNGTICMAIDLHLYSVMRKFIQKFILRSFKCFPAFLMSICLTGVSPARADDFEQNLRARTDLLKYVDEELSRLAQGYGWKLHENFWREQNIPKYAFIWHWAQRKVPKLPFRFVQESEFKVVGVEPDRLAINTGTEILWNAERLGQMKEFSLQKAVQILMHEYNHTFQSVKNSPHWENQSESGTISLTLEQKDQFVAEMVSYLNSKTMRAQNKQGETLSMMFLDAPEKMRDIYEYKFPRSFKELTVNRVVAWSETKGWFEPVESLAKMISYTDEQIVFSNSTELPSQNRDNKGIQPFPKVTIENLRVSTNGEFILKVSYDPYHVDFEGRKVDIPTAQIYRRTLTKNSRSFDFRELQEKSTYSITNIVDNEKGRFVTIDLSGVDSKLIQLGAKNIALLALEPSTGKRFSFQAQRLIQNKDSAKVLFMIPQKYDLVSTEILFVDRKNDNYKEYSILSANRQKISGEVRELQTKFYVPHQYDNRYKLDRFDAWMGTSDNILSLRLPSRFSFSDLKGATLETRAPLVAKYTSQKNMDETNSGYNYVRKVHLLKGQKIYFNQKDLAKYLIEKDPKRSSDFKIPIKGNGYSDVEADGMFIQDLYLRGITNIWLHMNDGEVIKLELESEPVARIKDVYKEKWDQRAKENRRQIFMESQCSNVFSK